MATAEADALIQQSIDNANTEEQRRLSKTRIEAQIAEVQNASVSTINSIQDVGAASTKIALAKEDLKAGLDAKQAATLALYSTNVMDAGSRLAQLEATMVDSYNKSTQLGKEVSAKKESAANFLGNPLTAIFDQITLPSSIEQYNTQARIHNNAEAEQKRIVATTTAVGQMNEVTKATTSATIQLGIQEQQAALTAQAVSEQKVKLGAFNIDAISRLQNMDEQGLQRATQLNQMKLSVVGIGLQRQHLALAEDSRKLQMAQLQDRLDAKESTRMDQQTDLASYNAGARKLGVAEIADFNQLKSLAKNPTALRIMAIGQEVQINGGNGSGVPIAGSAAESAALMVRVNSRLPNYPDSPDVFLTKSFMAQAAAPENGKDPNKILQATENSVQATSKLMAAGIDKEGNVNIYRAGAIEAVMTASKAVKENAFVQAILKPQADANPTAAVDPDLILGAASSIVKANPKQLDEAVKGIKIFFQAAAINNNAQRDYESRGLLPQKDYRAKLSTGSLWGTKVYDLTDEVDIKRVLMIQAGRNPDGGIGQSFGAYR